MRPWQREQFMVILLGKGWGFVFLVRKIAENLGLR
jgi:hypothetical protein